MVPILTWFIIEKSHLFFSKLSDTLSFNGIACEGIQNDQLETSLAMDFRWLTKACGPCSSVRIYKLKDVSLRTEIQENNDGSARGREVITFCFSYKMLDEIFSWSKSSNITIKSEVF